MNYSNDYSNEYDDYNDNNNQYESLEDFQSENNEIKEDNLSSKEEFENDYRIENIKVENFNNQFIGKPRNTLDLLNYSGEEYEFAIMKKKINQKLSQFNFEPKINEEIINICFLYRKKIKLYRLFPLVLFKIIKKYKLPIQLKNLKKSVKLNMNNYFKNSNDILIESNKKEESFDDIIFSYIDEYINKLIKLSKTNTRIFKKKANEKENLLLTQKINQISSILINSNFSSKNCFYDYESELNRLKMICKDKIYGNSKTLIKLKEENDFEDFFSGKIQNKTLALSLIKYEINEKCDFSISLKNLHQIFDISTISINKGINLIKQYNKMNNNEIK